MEKNLHHDSDEALEQAAKRSCEYPIPGTVQGQRGWGFGQPGLAKGAPVLGMGGWILMVFKVPSNASYSMIL